MNNLKSIHTAFTMYADDNYGYIPLATAVTPDWKLQKGGFGSLYSYAKTEKIFVCVNSTPKSAMPVYEIVLPVAGSGTPRKIKGSYHYWPHLYRAGGNMPKLDVNLRDRSLELYNSGFSAKSIERAIYLGGPLIDCFLHNMESNNTYGNGVLVLSMKGNVKFTPVDGYPWTY